MAEESHVGMRISRHGQQVFRSGHARHDSQRFREFRDHFVRDRQFGGQ